MTTQSPRKLVYFVAVSLDGFIASPNGDFSAFPTQATTSKPCSKSTQTPSPPWHWNPEALAPQMMSSTPCSWDGTPMQSAFRTASTTRTHTFINTSSVAHTNKTTQAALSS